MRSVIHLILILTFKFILYAEIKKEVDIQIKILQLAICRKFS